MRYHIHSVRRRTSGFTLIELLVSVALFTVVVTASVGTLLALVSANQKAQSLKSVINNLHFSVDSMARTIRTGRSYFCAAGGSIPSALPSGAQDCVNGETGLVLTDDHGARLAYRFTAGRIERKVGTGAWVALTAPEVAISDMRFYVTGTTAGDGFQPSVTLSIRGSAGRRETTDSSFEAQTTITQRVLDE